MNEKISYNPPPDSMDRPKPPPPPPPTSDARVILRRVCGATEERIEAARIEVLRDHVFDLQADNSAQTKRIEYLEKEVSRFCKAVIEYGVHRHDDSMTCNESDYMRNMDCNCGFDEIRERADLMIGDLAELKEE